MLLQSLLKNIINKAIYNKKIFTLLIDSMQQGVLKMSQTAFRFCSLTKRKKIGQQSVSASNSEAGQNQEKWLYQWPRNKT